MIIAGLIIAGNEKFFKNKYSLSIGPSLVLTDLAREIAGGETAGKGSSSGR